MLNSRLVQVNATVCNNYVSKMYVNMFTWRVLKYILLLGSLVTTTQTFSLLLPSAVQTPGFSPPAPAPAKKTPAPGKKLRLRQKTCEN